MTHAITDIRDRINTVLTGVSGLSTFVSRAYNLQPSQLPAAVIEVGASTVVLDQMGNIQSWQTDFLIRFQNQDTTDIDASTFGYIELALNALGADPQLGGLADDSMVSSVGEAERSADADQPIESREVIFTVAFCVAATAQGTPL